MKTLEEIYLTYAGADARSGCDKNTIHSYIECYKEILAPYRATAKRVLEIGIMGGHSLRMWEEYFENADVHGADLSDRPVDGLADLRPMIAENKHLIHLFDATDPAQVESRFPGVLFDVIIEDANHDLASQLAIYKNFRHHVALGGIYIIEDIENIDRDRKAFEQIDPDRSVEIRDLRKLKNRFDDVLVVIGEKVKWGS